MEILDLWDLASLAVPLLAVGGAWGGAKVAMSRTSDRVVELSSSLKEHIHDDNLIQRDILDRAARMETKIDYVITRLEKL